MEISEVGNFDLVFLSTFMETRNFSEIPEIFILAHKQSNRTCLLLDELEERGDITAIRMAEC